MADLDPLPSPRVGLVVVVRPGPGFSAFRQEQTCQHPPPSADCGPSSGPPTSAAFTRKPSGLGSAKTNLRRTASPGQLRIDEADIEAMLVEVAPPIRGGVL